MQSSGGIITAEEARRNPVQTLLSGPVGGTRAGAALWPILAEQQGLRGLVCIDMGGTSFDVSLVVDGDVEIEMQTEIDGHHVLSPAAAIHTIGAGGGSVAHVEAGGLRVGPRSAGAVPGPACYGRGGSEPTVTDCNLLLGRLPARPASPASSPSIATPPRTPPWRRGQRSGCRPSSSPSASSPSPTRRWQRHPRADRRTRHRPEVVRPRGIRRRRAAARRRAGGRDWTCRRSSSQPIQACCRRGACCRRTTDWTRRPTFLAFEHVDLDRLRATESSLGDELRRRLKEVEGETRG